MQESIIGIYSFTQHIDPDGTPSRNDQRYLKIIIEIQEDQQFTYTYQKGHLSPTYTIEKGIWELKQNHLFLYTQEKSSQDFITQKILAKKYEDTHELIFDQYRLIDSFEDRIFRR